MKHYLWAFLWAVIVTILVIMPTGELEDGVPTFPGMDKLVHTGFFFVFTVLLYYGAIRRNRTVKSTWMITLKVIFVSSFFALFTEYIQMTIFTYRSADIWDLFADTVGTGMGVFAYILLHNTYDHAT